MNSAGTKRCWKLITITTAQLIWKLRCERVMGDRDSPFTNQEVKNRWEKAVNSRVKLDLLLMNPSLGSKALPMRKVLDTWGTVINLNPIGGYTVRLNSLSRVLVGRIHWYEEPIKDPDKQH
jgi:hypothetical protein